MGFSMMPGVVRVTGYDDNSTADTGNASSEDAQNGSAHGIHLEDEHGAHGIHLASFNLTYIESKYVTVRRC